MSLEGQASPPMANGEVIFEAPWQGRVFGMARLMCEQGYYEWDDFRECLIQRIASHSDASTYQYFDHFLGALTDLLEQKCILTASELDVLATALAQRPHGHDHHHDH